MTSGVEQAEREANREHDIAVALAHLNGSENSGYHHDRLYGSGDKERCYKLILDEYRAEHPADDEDDIQNDWLESCGGVPVTVPAGYIIHRFRIEDGCPENEIYLYVHEPDSAHERSCDLVSVDDGVRTGVGITAKWPRTRGQLRRLCLALGIQLKEPA